ncbi:TlpA disulfide reductase family protein [Flavobacterium sp. j3]|uniref:TlpA disulfide reductase family protein n=1 Tax=Flavobacterium aureirubrum TaxID=3133147 RepID=A0ABU9N8K9_9FLAO
MTKFTIALLLAFSSVTVFAQQTFFYNLSTTLPANKSVTKLYVSYEIAGIKYQDSLDFQKKQLTLKKVLPQPVAATISTNDDKIMPLDVMLANNNLNVVITDNSITIGKSKLHSDFLYLTENDRIRPTYFPLYGELSEKNDTIGLQKLGVVFDSLKKNDLKKSYDYFKANKTSLLSLFSFNRYTTFFADYSKVENDFALLPLWAKNSPEGKSTLAKIAGAKSAQVNTPAKNFVQQSLTGQKISLENYKGNYLLLDFWASWCAPCRKEHPNLRRTYEEFKTKNFEILSVSLDSNKKAWENAVTKDQLTWTQISDLKGQENDIAIQYGVQSVPANFLIDPKGTIIAKNLTSEQLHEMLEKLLLK